MHYLIDGHNLIGKLPDIDLSDPDDEAKLILRLKSWLEEGKSREATVIFDGRGMGGVANHLSGRRLTVVFSPSGEIADALIIRRLAKLRNPGGFTAVSSDNAILNAAKSRRIKHMKSEEFIERMGFVFEEEGGGETAVGKKRHRPAPPPDEPLLSEEEVALWLDMFGPVPERKPKPKTKAVKPIAPPPKPKPKARTGAAFATLAESEDPELNETEIAEWLDLFGPVEEPSPPKGKKKKKKTARANAPSPPKKKGNSNLSVEDQAAWDNWFGQ